MWTWLACVEPKPAANPGGATSSITTSTTPVRDSAWGVDTSPASIPTTDTAWVTGTTDSASGPLCPGDVGTLDIALCVETTAPLALTATTTTTASPYPSGAFAGPATVTQIGGVLDPVVGRF